MCWPSSSPRVPRPSPEHPDMAEHSQALALEADGKTPAASALASGAEAPRSPADLKTAVARPRLALPAVGAVSGVRRRPSRYGRVYQLPSRPVCGDGHVWGLVGWGFLQPLKTRNDKTAMVLQLVAWTTLAGPFGTLIAIALLVPRSAGASHVGASRGRCHDRPAF